MVVITMRREAFAILLCIVLLPLALGEEGETHIIDEPIDEDLMLSGETIIINARVDGDVFLTAGTVEINAPITGDAFVAGGTVTLDGEIGEDVIAAGSQVKIKKNVAGKVIAAGGMVEIDGEIGEKVILAGGQVRLGGSSVVGGKAYLVGGQVVNAGDVRGTLAVRSGSFRNSGTAAEVDHKSMATPSFEMADLSAFMGLATMIVIVLGILVSLGFLVAGVLFLKYFPRQFLAIETEVRHSPLRNIVMGLILIIVTAILVAILAVTFIGFPLAVILGLLSAVALLTSGMFVSLALGRWIGSKLNLKVGDIWLYVIGWVILTVLTFVPFLGLVFNAVALCLGYGSIFYAVKDNWDAVSGPTAGSPA
jgi:hypothetical protein